MLPPKLLQALRERDASQPLPGPGELDAAYLGGEAPGRREDALPGGGARASGGPPGPGAAAAGAGVRSAGLGRFRGVQDAGCPHRPTVTGGGQGRCETPGLQGVHTLLGNVQRHWTPPSTPAPPGARGAA